MAGPGITRMAVTKLSEGHWHGNRKRVVDLCFRARVLDGRRCGMICGPFQRICRFAIPTVPFPTTASLDLSSLGSFWKRGGPWTGNGLDYLHLNTQKCMTAGLLGIKGEKYLRFWEMPLQ